MSTNHNPYDVQVGQVWIDNDSRGYGRRMEILEIDETHAVTKSPSGRGRTTRIRLDRFRPNSTGYRLLRATASPLSENAGRNDR